MQSLALVVAVAVGALLAATVGWLVATRRRLTAEMQLFAGFMEHGHFLAFMKDADGRYIYENRALVYLVGRIRPGTKTLIGLTDAEVFDSPDGSAYVTNDHTVIAHGQPMQFDERSVQADGTVHDWSTIKFPRTDDRGRPCIAGISIDVTALRQARTEAKSSEDRCSLALEAGSMGSMSLDLATMMLDTSPVFAVLHGRPETSTRLGIEESLAQVHPDDRPAVRDAIRAAVEKRAPDRIRYRIVKPDATIAWIELVGNVFHDEAGRPIIVRGVAFDVTERQQAFDALARSRDTLRRLIDVQENERQTLCHELHDGLIQYAIGAKMHLESARDEADAASRTERLDAAIHCLERGIAEGRQVIRGVRPAVLDDLGLVAAIEDLTEQMSAAGVAVDTTLDPGLDSLPPSLCTTIYRVVQESLTNVRKHVGADHATVEVRRVGGEVHLRVRDRGPGFDVDAARGQGFGVIGMTERVRLTGGTFWIESQPGAGTQVNARLPIPADDGWSADDGAAASYAAAPAALRR